MRLLVTFMLVALLAAQFEYLSDVSAFLSDTSGGEELVVAGLQGMHADDELDHDGCDHCCHGANHVTGITVSMPRLNFSAGSSCLPAVPAVRVSLTLTPPIRPPIA